MAKEIRIDRNKIEVFKEGSLHFSTNFAYLKTDPNGNLRTGGYERCPVFAGSNYGNFPDGRSPLGDLSAFGGFPSSSSNSGRVNGAASGDLHQAFTLILPDKAIPMISSYPSRTTLNNLIYLRSPPVNILRLDRQSIVVGNFRWRMGIWVVYIDRIRTTRRSIGVTNLDLHGDITGGSELYFPKATAAVWYTDNGLNQSISQAQIDSAEQNVYAGFTIPPTSLSIAVTP